MHVGCLTFREVFYGNFLIYRVKDAAFKCDKMFVSEKKVADILIRVSSSFAGLGTRETTDLDRYVVILYEI